MARGTRRKGKRREARKPGRGGKGGRWPRRTGRSGGRPSLTTSRASSRGEWREWRPPPPPAGPTQDVPPGRQAAPGEGRTRPARRPEPSDRKTLFTRGTVGRGCEALGAAGHRPVMDLIRCLGASAGEGPAPRGTAALPCPHTALRNSETLNLTPSSPPSLRGDWRVRARTAEGRRTIFGEWDLDSERKRRRWRGFRGSLGVNQN